MEALFVPRYDIDKIKIYSQLGQCLQSSPKTRRNKAQLIDSTLEKTPVRAQARDEHLTKNQ